MKVFALLGICLLLVACQPTVLEPTAPAVPKEPVVRDADFTCVTDADCTTSGCSGTICQHVNVGPSFTTCEWREEYACYQEANCGCVRSQCAWQDGDLEACIAEKSSAEV